MKLHPKSLRQIAPAAHRFSILACAALTTFALPASAAPGDLDPTFGGTGIVFTPAGSGFRQHQGMTLQSDGKIVVAANSGLGSFALVRYNPSGTLDTTFNWSGLAVADTGKQTRI